MTVQVKPNVWYVPKETREWIGPIVVKANAVVVVTWKVLLLADGVRPVTGDWAAADPIADGADLGVMAQSLSAGPYKIWVRYSTALEDVVLDDVGVVVAH